MYSSSPYQKYQQNTVQTASPAQLLLKLYDGAIRFVRLGIEGIQQKDIEKTSLNLNKAQSIINEFIASLDNSMEISKQLYALYEYMNYQLIQANIKKDQVMAEEVLGYLVELRTTWAQANMDLMAQKPSTVSG